MKRPVESRNNIFGDKIDPDACICAFVGISWEEARGSFRICIFEEFAEDEGFVECFAVVLDCGD